MFELRSLIVYVSGSDVRPKDIIDMRVCYVALIEGEVSSIQISIATIT